MLAARFQRPSVSGVMKFFFEIIEEYFRRKFDRNLKSVVIDKNQGEDILIRIAASSIIFFIAFIYCTSVSHARVSLPSH
jgi:hypothetical protein